MLRQYFVVIIFTYFIKPNTAQVTVYSANFNSGFQGWTSVALTSPWTNQPDFLGYYNVWYTGDGESGMPPNTCGAANQGNPTLHMGWEGNPSGGAAYHSNAQTNRRIQSPNISTVGYSNLTLQFDFIGNGCQTRDRAYLQYSTDGGGTWTNATGAPTTATPALPTGSNLNNLKSQICGSGQGRWTRITWNMPAACNNIPNLRIAFVWQNSDNASCSSSPSDPSFAVDNIIITAPNPVPVELIFFDATLQDQAVELQWATASEINNDYFTIERSIDGQSFEHIAIINGAGNSNEPLFYSYTDHSLPDAYIIYYRLKQTDYDGTTSYFPIRAVQRKSPPEIFVYPIPLEDVLFIDVSNMEYQSLYVEIISVLGQQMYAQQLHTHEQFTTWAIPVAHFPPGGYLLKITDHYKNYFWKLNKP